MSTFEASGVAAWVVLGAWVIGAGENVLADVAYSWALLTAFIGLYIWKGRS